MTAALELLAMADLPLLVVHGVLVAKLAVALLTGVCLVVLVAARRRRERRRTADTVAARAVALTGLAPGFASLRGRLQGTACTLTEIEGVTGDAAHQRSDSLVIDVAGERVELAGDVRVVRGSRVTAGWRGLPSGTPSALRQVTWRGRRRLFSIDDGAEVIAQGVLERRASDTGYRDDAGSWVMRAALGEPAVELVAAQPSSLPVPLGPIRLALWSLVFVAGSHVALRLVGSQLIDRSADEDAMPISARAQVAAALPGSRSAALDHIKWQLRRAPRDATTFAQSRQLVAMTEGCAGLATWLLEQEQYEDLPAIAHGCNAKAEARALARLGRYAEAADLIAAHPGVMNDAAAEWVAIEIGASRWAEAATAGARVVDKLDDDARSGPGLLASLDQQRIAQRRCMVAWFRIQAGDRAARDQLVQLAATSGAPGCVLAEATQQTGESRSRALAAVRTLDRNGRDGELARALQWSDRDPEEMPSPATRFAAFSADPWVWLAPQMMATAGDPVERTDGIHVRRALHAVLAGATDDALAEARAVVGFPRNEIIAMVALHTPTISITWTDPPYGDEDLSREIALRRGQMRAARFVAGDCMLGIEAALPAAIAGDGGPRARVISTACDGVSSVVEMVLGAAPRVVQHRGELGEALRLFTGQLYVRDDLPFQFLAYNAFRRDLLRLTGEVAAAERWQGRVAGQLTMLADRQRTLALLLWQR